ncbi:6-carboxytetrahydropterin synthase QueD [Alicyclobacillus sp.]|uniref:6-carboxytetrahydropterin synthase QueD n=1 Tax=Alicyclobacillus sp. TaxID=61169 RepID=UPI0025C22D8F|nr:6-carboxytetrahydropterin synthase QueD [Alicyclobacillus sp.]
MQYHNRPVLVVKEFTFDAAHQLTAYEGKCKYLHGHTYRVQVGFLGSPDQRGIVMDFQDIKRIWKEHIEPSVDHRFLNESLPPMNTTAENLVYWLYRQFAERAPEGVSVHFVRLYETPTSYAEFRARWDVGDSLER